MKMHSPSQEAVTPRNPGLAVLPLLAFCLAAGLLATLWGYNYTLGNAEEQLPFIFRAMDPSYLANDFFTNTYAQYGPRTIFSEFVAFFTRLLPLTAVLFSLTFLANSAIAYLSALIAGHFFKRSKFSMFLAAAAVLSLKTFWVGYSNILYRNYLEPEHLAMPLVLLGFFWILKRKFPLAGLAFGLASLFHLLLGLELGWILLSVAVVETILQKLRQPSSAQKWKPLLAGCLVLAAFSAGLLIPFLLQPSIPADEFINLVAHVRHPHHYLPSFFEPWQYGQAALYLLGFGIMFWLSSKRSDTLRANQRYLLLIGGSIALLCLGGYLFVEIWPSRLWTTAQMFRLPYIIKWFSLVLMAGYVGEVIESAENWNIKLLGVTLGISFLSPAALATVSLIVGLRQMFSKRTTLPRWLLRSEWLAVITLILVVLFRPDFRAWALFCLLFSVIGFMTLFHWKRSIQIISYSGILLVSGIMLLFGLLITPPEKFKNETPNFALYSTTGELVDLAGYARNNTPVDAVFLTPPKFGEFRTIAERAIVVDFVAYPFQDQAMREWYQRIENCYGISDQAGFEALADYNQSVYAYQDDQIVNLANQYGFQYAVVYDSTVTHFPILYRTKSFKLVEVTTAPHSVE